MNFMPYIISVSIITGLSVLFAFLPKIFNKNNREVYATCHSDCENPKVGCSCMSLKDTES